MKNSSFPCLDSVLCCGPWTVGLLFATFVVWFLYDADPCLIGG